MFYVISFCILIVLISNSPSSELNRGTIIFKPFKFDFPKQNVTDAINLKATDPIHTTTLSSHELQENRNFIRRIENRSPKQMSAVLAAKPRFNTESSTHTYPKEIKVFNIDDEEETLNHLNKDLIISLGKQGIAVKKEATTYLFDSIWHHLFVLDLPKFDKELVESLDSLDCIDFINIINENVTKEILTGSNRLQTILRQTCEDVEQAIQVQIDSTLAMSKDSIESFRNRQLKRNKRLDPITLGLIAGGTLIGSFLINREMKQDSDIKDLSNDFEKLAQRVDQNAYVTAVLKEKLVGISRAIADSNDFLDNKLELLKNTTQSQLNMMSFVLGQQLDKLDSNQYMLAIMTFNSMFKLIKLNRAQDISTIMLDLLNLWDIIFSDLRKNVLSHSLISWKKLYPILMEIQENVKYTYELGIPIYHYELYYKLELINYQINPVNNQLLIYFQIPLKRPGRAMQFQLISLRSFGIPCREDCSLLPSGNNSIDLIAVKPSSNTWLVHKNTLYRESDFTDFSCIQSSQGKDCFTFTPELLRLPSKCSIAMFNWNDARVAQHCQLIQRANFEYMPISIEPHTYILHSELIKKYTLICKGKETKEYSTKDFAMLVKIPPQCEIFMPNINRTILGPFEGRLKGSVEMKFETFHTTFLNTIKESINKTRHSMGMDQTILKNFANNLREYDENKYALNFSLDNNKLSSISAYLYQTQSELNNLVIGMNYRLNNNHIKFTIYNYISLIGDGIRVLTTLVVIFGILTHTRLFGCIISGVVIIEYNQVEAFTGELLENSEASIANIILVLLFIILLAFYIKAAYFRTTIISSHHGNTNLKYEVSDFSMIVNINHRVNHFKHIKVENIYIRVPLSKMNSDVEDVRIINTINYWVMKDKVLQLANPIEIYGLNGSFSRVNEKKYDIKIPVKNINWVNKEPEMITQNNAHNIAVCSIIKHKYKAPMNVQFM